MGDPKLSSSIKMKKDQKIWILLLFTVNGHRLQGVDTAQSQNMAANTAGGIPADPEPFHPALTRKLLQEHLRSSSSGSTKKISTEALVAAGEVLRCFVQEVHHRAGIEAECEHESAACQRESVARDVHDNEGSSCTKSIPITADHIVKAVGEVLMDFS
jgi:CENP-S associating Centromere protein X